MQYLHRLRQSVPSKICPLIKCYIKYWVIYVFEYRIVLRAAYSLPEVLCSLRNVQEYGENPING